MSVLSVRNVLPVVTSVLATLFLATAVPHERGPEAAIDPAARLALARIEVQRCVDGGRDGDECVDEAAGRAVIERAEWLARDPASVRQASR
jgi:rRNA-processing protein FCF1